MSFLLHTLSFGKKLYIFLRVQGQGTQGVRTRIARTPGEGASHYTTATYLFMTLIIHKKKSVYNDNIVKQFNTWPILLPRHCFTLISVTICSLTTEIGQRPLNRPRTNIVVWYLDSSILPLNSNFSHCKVPVKIL